MPVRGGASLSLRSGPGKGVTFLWLRHRAVATVNIRKYERFMPLNKILSSSRYSLAHSIELHHKLQHEKYLTNICFCKIKGKNSATKQQVKTLHRALALWKHTEINSKDFIRLTPHLKEHQSRQMRKKKQFKNSDNSKSHSVLLPSNKYTSSPEMFHNLLKMIKMTVRIQNLDGRKVLRDSGESWNPIQGIQGSQ